MLTSQNLAARLHGALPATADAAAVATLAVELHNAWDEPQRAYHTPQHLQECLALLDAVSADQPPHDAGALTLALLFHDAIYDPQAHDNEARSADWAAAALPPLGVPPQQVAKVQRMVLATQLHRSAPGVPATEAQDTALLLDIDLAILGAEPGRFAEYEAQIRREYAHVPDAAYQVGRAKVMRGFAARAPLFLTAAARGLREAHARANLAPWRGGEARSADEAGGVNAARSGATPPGTAPSAAPP